MAQPSVLYWPPAFNYLYPVPDFMIPTQIVSLQSSSAAGNLVLNSNAANNPFGPFIMNNMIRSVAFYSPENLGTGGEGLTLTINGIGCSSVSAGGSNPNIPNGLLGPISETLNAPYQTLLPGGQSYFSVSTNWYSQINSIYINGGTGGALISGGYSTLGSTAYHFFNNDSKNWAASVCLQIIGTPGEGGTYPYIYGVFASLNKPWQLDANGNQVPYVGTSALPFFVLTSGQAAAPSTTILPVTLPAGTGYNCTPVATVWASFGGNLSENNNMSAVLTILQQGIV